MNIRKDLTEEINLVVLGDDGVGKSTLIAQYVANISPGTKLDDETLAIYPATIQVKMLDHSIKLKIYEKKSISTLDENLSCSGFICIFSFSNKKSLNFAESELKKLIGKNCKSKVILLGNKIGNADSKIKPSQSLIELVKQLNITYIAADVKHKSKEIFDQLIKLPTNRNDLSSTLGTKSQQIDHETKEQCLLNIIALINSLIDSYFNKDSNYVLENIQHLKQDFSNAISKYYENKNEEEVLDHYNNNIKTIYVKWFAYQSKSVTKKLKYFIDLYGSGLLEKTRMIDDLVIVGRHLNKGGIIDINKKYYKEMSSYAKQINNLPNSSKKNDDIFIQKHNFAKALIESLSAGSYEQQENLNVLSNHFTTLKLHFMSRNISDTNLKKLKKHQSDIIFDLLLVYIQTKKFNDIRMDYKSFHHVKFFKLSAKVDIVDYYRAAVKHLKQSAHKAEGEEMLNQILQITKEATEPTLENDNNTKVKRM